MTPDYLAIELDTFYWEHRWWGVLGTGLTTTDTEQVWVSCSCGREDETALRGMADVKSGREAVRIIVLVAVVSAVPGLPFNVWSCYSADDLPRCIRTSINVWASSRSSYLAC